MTCLMRSNPAWALVAVLFVASVAVPLIAAIQGSPPFRDIHLGTALHYVAHGFGLEKTMIIGFNANGTPTIQEFPLWQMLAGAAMKVMGPWWGWANAVSILLFASVLYPLHRLSQRWSEPTRAPWVLVFFLSQPLVFRYFGLASTDGVSIASAIWFCHFGSRLLDRPQSASAWIGALGCGILSALLKLPFFMAAGAGLFLVCITGHPLLSRQTMSLGIVGAATALCFAWWTRYTAALQEGALFPLVDLRLSNPEMVAWYFGDWGYRLNPANWAKGGWRILNTLFGSFVLCGVAALGLFKQGIPRFALCMLGGGLLTILVFTHLVLHHSHYYLMFTMPVAFLLANGAGWLQDRLAGGQPGRFAAFCAPLIGLSILQGLIGMKTVVSTDPYPRQMASIIAGHTAPGDKLVIRGGGWGGELLFRSSRDGLSVWNTRLLEDPDHLAELKRRGFNKLVMVSESPLLDAVQRVNPGNTGRKRELYHGHRTAVVESWPVVFQNEDLVIQDIP